MNKFIEDIKRFRFFLKKHPLKALGFMGLMMSFIYFYHPHHEPIHKGQKEYTVSAHIVQKTLHFNGNLSPLAQSPLVSPVDASIEKMHIRFGEPLQKNEIVFSLSSTELHRLYNEALTEYLKAKDAYTVTKNRFVGTEDLWQSGLISKNNYLSEKSTLHNSRISLLQATHKLNEVIQKMDNGVLDDPKNLKLSDIRKIEKALTEPHQFITLKAQSRGVLLSPPTGVGEGQNKPIDVGHSVKAGQVLALVGDLTGLHIQIEIPEVDIDKIHVNMPAKVSGVAFSDLNLQGKVISVNAEANANASSGALPTFNAVIEVSKLKAKEQKRLKVGMSTNVELTVSSSEQLMIPIEAISLEENQNVVFVKKDKEIERRVVSTGEAQAGRVAILSGLKKDEVVVYGQKASD